MVAHRPVEMGGGVIEGVSGGFCWWVLVAGVRSVKVVANAFRAGLQRVPRLVWPVPLGVRRSHGQVERPQRGLLVRETPPWS